MDPLQIDYSPARPHPDLRRPAEAAPATPRVPRPRNAFMIFRSAFWAEQKITRTVEHDHRHISRIVGHYWNKMSPEDKDFWRRKADQEKVDHERKHPGYRFCPTARTKKPVKRKVKRNGVDDLLRCQQVADLLLSGKRGNDLDDAINLLRSRPESEDPPFRSPLLPPISLPTTPEASPVFPLTPVGHYPEPQHVQPGTIPPLAYSIYHAQTTAHQSLDLSLPLHLPAFCADWPRGMLAFHNPYILCDSSSAPPLPGPESSANIMTEPLHWNSPFPFSS